MNAHTPGPWSEDADGGGFYVTGGNFLIASLNIPNDNEDIADGFTEDVQEANAQLIAAAPDLLAALKWCKSQGFARYTNRVKGSNDDFCDAVDRMDAAIAKATGSAA